MEEHRATTSVFGSGGAPPAAPIVLFAPGTEIGSRYEVRSVLGTGGHAVVYSAFDRELKRPVALKVLRADRMSEAALRRFRREAAVARDAASPRLVRVFDIGHAGECLFLTMELVDGDSLKDRMAAGRMPVDEAVRVVSEVLHGLAVLHALGIVHRDVKPANVLLSEDGSVKLADFGLALHLAADESRATETGSVVGTVEYLSPEQALGRELDGRSDLYAVGVMLSELLTGALPFHRDSPIATALARLRETAPDPRAARPEVPAWLAGVVARLLAAEPERRYATAGEVLADLERRSVATRQRARRRLGGIVAAAVLAAGAATALGLRFLPALAGPPRIARLVDADGKTGIRALDANGRLLWERGDVDSIRVAALLQNPGHGQRVAAVAGTESERTFGPEGIELSFLSARTGATERAFRLPAPEESAFPGYPPRFAVAGVEPLDAEGDGRDELLVTAFHRPGSPSYVVLHDPWTPSSRLLFLASGHHRPVGPVDLDGDGGRELVLAGIANASGWYSGIAAVRLPPLAEREVAGRSASRPAAATPDLGLQGSGALLWYALGPPAHVVGDTLTLPSGQRVLELSVAGNDPLRLDFDGFLAGTTSSLDEAGRRRERARAWDAVREAGRLALLGNLSEAAASAAAAASSASAAGDPCLAEWAGRVHASLLARSGDTARAEALFEQLLSGSPAASDIAADAGRAFHLRGELDRAVTWYVRSAGTGGRPDTGRLKWELVEGILQALVERGEQNRLDRLLGQLSAAYGEGAIPLATWKAVTDWRRGERPRPERLETYRLLGAFAYWQAEMKVAAGTAPRQLLAELGDGPEEPGAVGDLLRLLRAELRLADGAPPTAAWEEAETSYGSRADFDLATARFARVAEAAGRTEEAREARTFLARVWGRPGR
jgi:serine/threonine-protein kinase